MNQRRIVVDGDLTVTGPGVSARLHAGADGGARSLVVVGRPGGGLRAGRAAIRRAAGVGLSLKVMDARGRELVKIGPDERSVLGRLLLGTDRARPTLRGLVAARRGAAAPHAVPSIDHGGTGT